MKAPGPGVCQDAARGVGQGRVVRHLGQSEGASQLRPLGDQGHHAPVVHPQELPEHQQREELRPGVVLARVRAGVLRQRRSARYQRLPCHPHRRL